MVVSIGSDHAGYDLRQKVIAHLKEKGFEVIERGAPSADQPYSWVEAGELIADDILSGRAEKGIAICGTGIGISIACNKFKGIRCALSHNEYTAKVCRQHNDANILAFGARVIGQAVALGMVDAFFEGSFDGGRHAERVGQLKAIEDKNFK